MQIEVCLFATLRENRFASRTLDVPEGSTIQRLLEQLQIPAAAAPLRLCNGQHVPLDRPLTAGDVVSLFPPVAGG